MRAVTLGTTAACVSLGRPPAGGRTDATAKWDRVQGPKHILINGELVAPSIPTPPEPLAPRLLA